MERKENVKPSVGQEEIQNMLFNREIGWQEIIYDLINTEQLDPWNINLVILTDKYLQKIQELEEADFFISSKVLLAASLLLRIKSELLLNKYIRSIDEILFGKKENKKSALERIELDEEIPLLVPKSPIPRFRKVSLEELMEALNKAIVTENRRIKKEILKKNTLRETAFSLPKKNYSIKDKINEIYKKLIFHFEENKEQKKINFSTLFGQDRESKVLALSPLLHLENQKKVWLDQQNHFQEIEIWLHSIYMKHNPDMFADLKIELEAEFEKLSEEDKKKLFEDNEDFENPVGKMFETDLEKDG